MSRSDGAGMDTKKILIESREDLAVISLHNPPENSLDAHTLKELGFIIHRFRNRSSPKAIILRSKRAIFSACAELKGKADGKEDIAAFLG
jgi:enoyl-CoA hydratase/carnithine racemase